MERTFTAVDRAQYERDGFIVAPNLYASDEMDALLDRTAYYAEHPKKDILIQIEPRLTESLSPLESIRKIEQLVAHDELFLAFARDSRTLARFQALLGGPVRLFRDALMWKPARVGSAKPYHQDSAYWKIEPMDLCSVWVALEDATVENGCMRVIPGSHNSGLIEHHHLEDYKVTDDHVDYPREVTLEMTKGSALFFHSLLLHATAPNTSGRSRRALILSCMGPRAQWTGDSDEEPDWLTLG